MPIPKMTVTIEMNREDLHLLVLYLGALGVIDPSPSKVAGFSKPQSRGIKRAMDALLDAGEEVRRP